MFASGARAGCDGDWAHAFQFAPKSGPKNIVPSMFALWSSSDLVYHQFLVFPLEISFIASIRGLSACLRILQVVGHL